MLQNTKVRHHKEDPSAGEQEESVAWLDLPATEKENYISFHKSAYQDDLKHAEKNMLVFPRWSIISGYYGMHDITKLFLAEKFNAKITSPEMHRKVIEALDTFIKDSTLKEKLVTLLKDAKSIYFNAERLKEKTLPALLRKGKQERSKAQYYVEDYTEDKNVNSQKASYFLETVVKPYINLIKGLMQ